MNMRFLFALSLFVAFLPLSIASAEIAPLSVDELKAQAHAIVVATVSQIRIEPEPSRFERGFGNSDWAIYLTLSLESVEKGNVSGQELEARCFRIRYRRSLTEYRTPSGHHPIPGNGTRVRAYLTNDEGSWNVVLPNGITAVDGNSDHPQGTLPDAAQVTQLRNSARAFTFLLPLEIWALVIVVGIPVLIVIRKSRRRKTTNDVTKDDLERSRPGGPM
jgi:hypothetical protein